MTKTETKAMKVGFPPQEDDHLKRIGGSRFNDFNTTVANQAFSALWLKGASEAERDKAINAALVALMGLAPKDELEGMLAAQMVAVHHATMECLRRAMLSEQTFEGRTQNLGFANKLARTYTMQMDALQRYRGKGQQKVTVEHVHVHAGGQAIVGAVDHTGGGAIAKTEKQSHAKQSELQPVTYAPSPTLPCPHPAGDALPVARDAQRQVPHARRARRSPQG